MAQVQERTGPAAAFRQIVARSHASGQLRVWSIIISVFGDLVLPRRGDIAAVHLQTLLERMAIDAGAMRTAVSRLAKEGWVIRERAGRSSTYRLSPAAIPEFELATRTIYAAERPAPEGPLRLVITPERAEPPGTGNPIPIRRGVYLCTGSPGDDPGPEALVTDAAPERIPAWARQALLPERLASDLLALEARIMPLARALRAATMTAEDAASARALLVHHWRRVALRHPPVPAELVPPDWPEARCRRIVLGLHNTLTETAEPWLDRALPRADQMLQNLS